MSRHRGTFGAVCAQAAVWGNELCTSEVTQRNPEVTQTCLESSTKWTCFPRGRKTEAGEKSGRFNRRALAESTDWMNGSYSWDSEEMNNIYGPINHTLRNERGQERADGAVNWVKKQEVRHADSKVSLHRGKWGPAEQSPCTPNLGEGTSDPQLVICLRNSMCLTPGAWLT